MKWWLALHLISVICWFAGLFYLPRIFVYHAMTEKPEVDQQFKVMERKLFYYIMTPAAALTIISGFILMSLHAIHGYWLLGKLGLVAFLIIYHFACGYYLKLFKHNMNPHSHKFYRYFNEVPTVLLIAIVIIAVVKPF